MEMSMRKRTVSSCIPCYTKKQKCNRQYPCDQCSRRRRPELCAYYPSQAQLPARPRRAQTHNLHNEDVEAGEATWEKGTSHRASDASSTLVNSPSPTIVRGPEDIEEPPLPLADVFGYCEESKRNTMALLRTLGVTGGNRDLSVSKEIAAQVQKTLEDMPSRPILDFLIQYFVAEVNWVDQLLYPPRFLAQYQHWWDLGRPSLVGDIEFSVLFLRICLYASQFLPSPTYTMDSIRGVTLTDIRKSCTLVADTLEKLCTQLDSRGSLLRVQHLAVSGLVFLCQSRNNAFCVALSNAIRVAQTIGMHLEDTSSNEHMDELDKEMRRRTLCNLYILDSMLSRRLDRIPLLPIHLAEDNLPRMQLMPGLEDTADAPDVFAERSLQARLAEFWRKSSPPTEFEYDVLAAEERYEMFCSEFLPMIPPTFSLCPDRQWDDRLPKLPLQRQNLHVAIYDSLCYNFKPVLLQDTKYTQSLPCYKQILLSSHKKALAAAALKVLEGASTLHTLMGGSHTRFAGIIVPTFEAAVPLLCLCADSNFPEDTPESCSEPESTKTDLLRDGMIEVTRDACMQAVRNALARLQVLAEASDMAEVGARTLARLISNLDSSPTDTQGQLCKRLNDLVEPGMEPSQQYIDPLLNMVDVFSDTDSSASHSNWEEIAKITLTSWHGNAEFMNLG
ncbi:hypothetical protein F5X96DRAFT_633628 [Biscogniauxia mediterranea]|nr:hypothetical protein F5X96DRAFT_633628 [Biscogniauxia mediterranea]